MLSLLFGQGRQVDAVSDEGDDKENDGLLRQRTEEAFRVLSSFILGARELGTTMDSIPASTVEIIFTSLSDFSGTIRQYPPATHTLRQAIARADDGGALSLLWYRLMPALLETLHAAIRRCIEALDGVWKVEGLAEMEVLDRIGGFATLLVVLVCSRPERMAPGMVSQALMAILNVMTSEGLVELSGEDPK
ncbi:hypothetical protein Pmar_PMAR012189 [Perkinsus marinus ATCC 50983]|uniref:Uncharacterized protein n=1 Tax=Perkinsus marinus (strain ATCC 50983 / TXsc) TaxID=423536 RepID=C5K867_PERM5|nr:hypothetical protein Pmar_PMAR012189 [Perkinsus marinus ATCC 50983]EER19337.1 hypothetical protein Pmar_PMAR012189 [Perkinsus marinus ATCC 50983]|eukprot:XP_002787541.1 hypothetical protein Pmar_PMAR012189 [Perkinsus marinus ATCC 50983]